MLAQVAIDNCKRKYDVDLEKEIPRINEDMNVSEMGLPKFWQITKKDKRKARTDEERQKRQKENKEKILKNINNDLICPMNYLFDISFEEYHYAKDFVIPMKEFFINHSTEVNRRKSRKVEELIEKYSIEFHDYVMNTNGANWKENEVDLLLINDFNQLLSDIRSVYISKNYLSLMSWLINRAMCIGAGAKRNKEYMDSNTEKNRPILLKTLYTLNPKTFMACFVEKLHT